MYQAASIYGNRWNGLALSAEQGTVVERYAQRELLITYLAAQGIAAPRELVLVEQVHGVEICTIYKGTDLATYVPRSWTADVIITTIPALMIGVLTADCVPLIIYNKERPILAVVHAGWRGIVAGIVERTVERIIDDSNLTPEQLTARIGPAAGRCCYRVTEEFGDHLSGDLCERMVRSGGDWYFDLGGSVLQIVAKQGLSIERESSLLLCTVCSPDYHSYRRDGSAALRNVTLAWIEQLR